MIAKLKFREILPGEREILPVEEVVASTTSTHTEARTAILDIGNPAIE